MLSKMWTVFCLIGFLALVLPGCGGGGGGGEVAPSVPTGLTLTPQSIKTFRFEWQDSDGETEYRLLENPDGVSGYSEVATLPAGSTEHELTVSLPGRINASYALLACNDAGCRDSDPVFVNTNLAEAVGYFKASNTDAGDSFGSSVAIASDGKTLVVGAPREASSATGVDKDETDNTANVSGAVYVFVQNEGVWSMQAYIKASNTEFADRFGHSISLSADGATLAVGAIGEDSNATIVDGDDSNNDASNAGAVYVFTRDAGAWSQEAYIKAENAGAGDRFGHSVSLSADGDTLAVGADTEASTATGVNRDGSINTAVGAGATYVFTRDANNNWSQEAYIKASNTDAGDRFGHSVSLSLDGDTLAVGALFESSISDEINKDESDDSAGSAGAAYVFTRDAGGWSQEAYIKASNTDAQDRFGQSASLAADGDTLAVGAIREDSIATGINGDESDDSAASAGAAYVFTRDAGGWSQEAYIKASNTDAGDLFGIAVALSADGNQLVVGAEEEASNAAGIGGDDADNSLAESGAVYVFRRDAGIWSQKAYVKAPMPGGNDQFGTTVALSGDGDSLVVGATGEDSESKGINGDPGNDDAIDAGAVYLY